MFSFFSLLDMRIIYTGTLVVLLLPSSYVVQLPTRNKRIHCSWCSEQVKHTNFPSLSATAHASPRGYIHCVFFSEDLQCVYTLHTRSIVFSTWTRNYNKTLSIIIITYVSRSDENVVL